MGRLLMLVVVGWLLFPMLPTIKAPQLSINPDALKYHSLRRVGFKPKASPAVVDDIVTTAARENGIDPKVLRGLIHVESNGNQTVVSGAGAKGLTQLLDDTGREWHRKLGIRRPYDPYDVTQSVRIGAAYLRFLIDYYDGNIELALTAYNQGYGRVDKLIAKKNAKSLGGIIAHLGPDGKKYARNVLAVASKLRG